VFLYDGRGPNRHAARSDGSRVRRIASSCRRSLPSARATPPAATIRVQIGDARLDFRARRPASTPSSAAPSSPRRPQRREPTAISERAGAATKASRARSPSSSSRRRKKARFLVDLAPKCAIVNRARSLRARGLRHLLTTSEPRAVRRHSRHPHLCARVDHGAGRCPPRLAVRAVVERSYCRRGRRAGVGPPRDHTARSGWRTPRSCAATGTTSSWSSSPTATKRIASTTGPYKVLQPPAFDWSRLGLAQLREPPPQERRAREGRRTVMYGLALLLRRWRAGSCADIPGTIRGTTAGALTSARRTVAQRVERRDVQCVEP